ncbi:MAG: GTPase HflX [Halothiobacillus sp. 24-54-40]|jgi:GTP-binding protein HflX|nr:GTPase HflX [Halothiobacillaceae bacterium]OYY44280.1 MAG: GTPase HflX [Halothiobacillus sp. 35-54-62]OYY56545.1 MAG: GTPase HflX [Halothiobacillus sp. 28-55-5]OYZ88396.1 MAG: GTPase HflX [Halothiobacillus sp. 24-54-40]OZA81704.1 MAG: GTPase HflX [Halothiobacillus sp. 39-53-45]HQS01803.1 GTPase HflX [Halothiobacillus sp.]
MQFFERHEGGERAVLLHVVSRQASRAEDLDEFRDLVDSAGASILDVCLASREAPDPRLYIGKGKAQELAEMVQRTEADLVVVNAQLSPSQERNLEKLLECRVLDRTGLILDIFSQRARSHEGKLQVELAQLKHLSTRLIRGWTHLDSQRGGAIGLRGPGETQLELDRRLIHDRIKQLQERIAKVRRQRLEGRKGRQRSEVPLVSLVGYTNAGKSTLFNALTSADTFAADQLFATLDTTLRRMELAPNQPLVLADTVGFIRHLPTELVTAFRSTLEETLEADLLIHVVDAASDERDRQMADVDVVLKEIGADRLPRLTVMNKIDQIDGRTPQIDYNEAGEIERVWVSAHTGAGIAELRQALLARLSPTRINVTVFLPATLGGVRARLIDEGSVCSEAWQDADGAAPGWQMQLRLTPARLSQWQKHHPELQAHQLSEAHELPS